MDPYMDEVAALAALDPQYPAWSRFEASRRDLMVLWFMAASSAPGGIWVLEYIRWWEQGATVQADAAVRLGEQMRESILSGELAKTLCIHIDPSAEPEAERVRMTLLFRKFADFALHSGGFEVRDTLDNDDDERAL